MTSPRAVPASLMLAVLLTAQPAFALVPSDLCTGNPCVISRSRVIEGAGALDFGPDTEVRLARGVVLRIGPPTEQILSFRMDLGQLVLEPGAGIVMRTRVRRFIDRTRSLDIKAASGSIEIARGARIDLSGGDGSELSLEAAGDVICHGRVNLRNHAELVYSGVLRVFAGGSVTLDGRIAAYTRGVGSGDGEISVYATGPVRVGGSIDATANDGSDVYFFSESSSIEVDGTIDASGHLGDGNSYYGSEGGTGGEISIEAPAGDVALSGLLSARAYSGASEESAGYAGEVRVKTGGSIILAADVDLRAGRGGAGGELDFDAVADFHQEPGATIDVGGVASEFTTAGFVEIDVGGDAFLGAIGLAAQFGGDLDVHSGGRVVVQGLINGRGPDDGLVSGGRALIRATTIDVEPGGTIDTRGRPFFSAHGVNRLEASGAMTIAGTLLASVRNELVYQTVPPVITGRVEPEATLILVP